MKKKTLLYLKMIAFVVILVILDQISKFVATANLMGKSKYIVIKGLLSFNYLEGGNKGAAWGIFSGKILMFVIITIIAIVIISIFMRNITGIMCNEGKSATLMVLQYTFGMLMAGAVFCNVLLWYRNPNNLQSLQPALRKQIYPLALCTHPKG